MHACSNQFALLLFKIVPILCQEGGHAFLLHGEEAKLQGALIAFAGDTPALAEVGGFKKSVGPALIFGSVVNVWPQKIRCSYM